MSDRSGMICAVLLDFGGTLDGSGHWLDRFTALWAGCEGATVGPTRIEEAFYEADRQLEADPTIGRCRFREMMRRHAAWQLRHLGIDEPSLVERLASGFSEPAEHALQQSRAVLSTLQSDGYRLGVLSNFYGNVAALCEEAGLAPLLDVVLDSAVVGLRKPDPRFFAEALARLGVEAAESVMVGDSFERDMRPAHALGMKTLWLAPGGTAAAGSASGDPGDPGARLETARGDSAVVDGVLESLSELPARLAKWRAAGVQGGKRA